jgi:hypothetical protein
MGNCTVVLYSNNDVNDVFVCIGWRFVILQKCVLAFFCPCARMCIRLFSGWHTSTCFPSPSEICHARQEFLHAFSQDWVLISFSVFPLTAQRANSRQSSPHAVDPILLPPRKATPVIAERQTRLSVRLFNCVHLFS